MVKAPDFGRMGLDEHPHAVIAMSAEGDVLYWSKGAEAMYGYAGKEAVGRTIAMIVVPPDRMELESRMLRDTLDAGVAAYESSRKAKNGSLVAVDVTKWAVRDTDGTLKFVVSIERNAAERTRSRP